MRLLKMLAVPGLLMAVVTSGFGQSQTPELLPLALGNKWTLTNPYVATPVAFEVVSDTMLGTKRRVRVAHTNPWSPYDFIFNPDGSGGILLEGLAVGTNQYYLNAPVTMFPNSGAAGQVWTTSAGSVTLVSTSATVTSPSKTYTACRHYRITLFGGTMDWYLSPGNGIVQVFQSPGHFVPGTITLYPYVPPPSTTVTTGPCPKLGVDSNPVATTTFSPADREAAIALAKNAGANFAHVSLKWSDIEKSPSVYDFTELDRWMGWGTKYGLDIALTVATINTTTISAPPDLSGRPLSDATLTNRFVAMMAAMSSRLTARVKWVNVGNEVDVYLRNNPSATAGVETFLQTVKTRLAASFGSRTFGMVLTHAARANPSQFAGLLTASGHAAFTYYPVNGDMTVRSPSLVSSEMAEMLAMAQGKPLVLTEVGFPTSSLLGSTEAMQATFVSNLFTAARAKSGKVAALNFFQKSDMPTTVVDSLVGYYNTSGYMTTTMAQKVGAFIGSLGMFTQSGAIKPAWTQFTTLAPTFAGATACTTN